MPVNRNALIRYKTIDKCLQNHYRKWTLDDLIEACSDALYEYEGIDKGVSKRSIQGDIQMMRSDKLGYNAPIIVVDRKYYAYEDLNYSITNIPLTDQDLGRLSEAVEFMKQFQGFSHFRDLDGMVQKLEDHIYSQKTHSKPAIDFEKNNNLKGLEYLDTLHRAIIAKKSLVITYQSFTARQANSFDFHPFLLKEYRNRWFLIGMQRQQKQILNLALDRIIKIEKGRLPFRENPDFDASNYFKNAVGVSISPSLEPEEVQLFIIHKHAPYVLTKPIHHSQREIDRDNFGVTIALNVQLNFELEKEILGYGDQMKVISPLKLKRRIEERLNEAVDQYKTEINQSGLYKAAYRLERNGFGILNKVYTQREIRKMGNLLHKKLSNNDKTGRSHRALLKHIPELKTLLFNRNLIEIIRSIDPNAFLVKSIFFEKSPEADWYVTWHQDIPINVNKKKSTAGYSAWTNRDRVISVRPPQEISKGIFSIRIHLDETNENNGALKVIAGSHNKVFATEELNLISNNSVPTSCNVQAGGIHLMRPLLLHASSKTKNQKKRRVIHLEFCSMELANGLEWAEFEALP